MPSGRVAPEKTIPYAWPCSWAGRKQAHCGAWRCDGASNPTNEGGHGDVEGFGEFPEGFDGDGLGAAFDLTDVDGVEVGGFGKLFLGETGAAPGFADVLPNGFPDGLDSRHP